MSEGDEFLRLRDGATAWQEVDGEGIVLDLEQSMYLGVNGSGAKLWAMIAAGTTRRRLVECLQASYAVDGARASGDVDRFIAEVRRRNLLQD